MFAVQKGNLKILGFRSKELAEKYLSNNSLVVDDWKIIEIACLNNELCTCKDCMDKKGSNG
jgi:hypothetical protein